MTKNYFKLTNNSSFNEVGILYSLSIEQKDKLKLMGANRSLETNKAKKHIMKIYKSFIKHGYLNIPLKINDSLEIIDGQHRFKAWELLYEKNPELIFDLLFIVDPKASAIDAQNMNTVPSKNWEIIDYVNSKRDGTNGYQKLYDFIQKYGLGNVSSFFLLTGRNSRIDGKTHQAFRDGDFIVSDDVLTKAEEIAETITQNFSNYSKNRTDSFVTAYTRLQYDKNYNHERFLNNWNDHFKDCLVGRSNENSIFVGLVEIHNFGNRVGRIKLKKK